MTEFYSDRNPARGTSVPPPEPTNSGTFDSAAIQRMIDERVAQIESAADARIKALEARYAAQLKAIRGNPPVDGAVPTHAAGPEHEVAQVWSLYHQELARAGKLTEAHLRHVRGEEPQETGSPE